MIAVIGERLPEIPDGRMPEQERKCKVKVRDSISHGVGLNRDP
jgi:hypothetical protein